MAIGLQSDMKIYDPRTQAGYRERLAQIIEIFNANSSGCIQLDTVTKAGNYDIRGFFARMSGLVTRRDLTSTSAATAIKPTQSEQVGVKLYRSIGPVDVARGALISAGISVGEDGAAFALGEWGAEAAAAEKVDTALAALGSAIRAVSSGALLNDISGGSGGAELMSGDALATGLSKRGDMATEVACWVMHSKPFFNLMRGQIASTTAGIGDVVLATASPISLNRPILVTDSASLVVTGSPTKYVTLGLTPGALKVEDTEEEYIVNDVVTGLAQIVHRIQGEYAYNLEMKGFTWDVANGGANPTANAVATATNWDKVYSQDKALAGVAILSQ